MELGLATVIYWQKGPLGGGIPKKGVPLNSSHCPEKRKTKFFTLKHFLEPIYQKKNIYSQLLEGGMPSDG